MADAAIESTINPAHSEWLADALMAEDSPPPAPVLFGGSPKAEQMELVRVIGDRMRRARELCNLSQLVAAKRLGYSNSSKLSKVELASDTHSAPLWLIVRAAKLYEVSVDFLFGLTDDWEIGAQRGAQGWLLDVWQEVRARDIALLEHLHDEISAISKHITTLVADAREISNGLETYRTRNPVFDETPASGMLAGRIERHAEHARAAENALRRFQQSLRPGADNGGAA